MKLMDIEIIDNTNYKEVRSNDRVIGILWPSADGTWNLEHEKYPGLTPAGTYEEALEELIELDAECLQVLAYKQAKLLRELKIQSLK